MRDGLWRTTLWVWYVGNLNNNFFDRLTTLCDTQPGQVGVLIKAFDGRYDWSQWNEHTVQRFRDCGAGVGLWGFMYGRGLAKYSEVPERHTVQDELWALDRALERAAPDAVMLNIEEQVMTSPGPAVDVKALVKGATTMCGPVGLSCVWHWAESMGWPFKAAVDGGVAYWSNQVYGHNWASYFDYQRLYQKYGAGLPDYISLSANVPSLQMDEDEQWAFGLGAPGVAWWEAASVLGDDWDVVGDDGPPHPGSEADAALEALWRQAPLVWGDKLWSGELKRDWAGEKVLRCTEAMLAYVDGGAVDITGRCLDNFTDYVEADGSLIRYP